MSRRWQRSLRRFGFPLVGWLSAAMYLIIAGGLPLPIPATATKDLSAPFPCMNRPCGCRNAAQCWTSCCCHTPTERVAWAREHGIAPPPSLIVEVGVNSSPSPTATCCTHTAPKTCCSSKASKSACCSSKGDSCHEPHAVASDNKSTTTYAVIGIHAMSCNGFGTDWVASLIALPPAIVGCEHCPLPSGPILMSALDFSSAALPPPVPPPRIAAS